MIPPPKTLCIGEILWDCFGETKVLGGAPFNAAAHLAQFGAESFLLSAVGNDSLGRLALEKAASAGISTDFIACCDGFPTGTALVLQNDDGSHRFSLPENTAYDQTALPEAWEAASPPFDALVFGSLAPFRSPSLRFALQTLASRNPLAERLLDVNLRLDFYDRPLLRRLLSLATICKVNEEEAKTLSLLLFGEDLAEAAFAEKVFEAFPLCNIVLVTKGAAGAAAFTRQASLSLPGIPVAVCDTVGAGDAFSAAFLAAFMETANLAQALAAGNAAGAFTAGVRGAFPAYTEEFWAKAPFG